MRRAGTCALCLVAAACLAPPASAHGELARIAHVARASHGLRRAFETVGTLQHELFAAVLDPFDCGPCEPAEVLAGGPRLNGSASVATQWSGGGAGDRALVVWSSQDPTTYALDVEAALVRTDAGLFVELGGGCGTGAAAASCATVGNAGGSVQRAVDRDPVALGAGRRDVPAAIRSR